MEFELSGMTIRTPGGTGRFGTKALRTDDLVTAERKEMSELKGELPRVKRERNICGRPSSS